MRAELGLAPLRGTGATSSSRSHEKEGKNDGIDAMDVDNNNDINHTNKKSPEDNNDSNNGAEEVLEMSVDDTNQLRAKLGLPPLRDVTSKVHDVDLVAKQKQEEEVRLEEREQLKEDVERGIQTTFTAKSLGEETSNDVSSWAAKLRQKASSSSAVEKDGKKTKKKKSSKKLKQGDNNNDTYDESDLKGMTVSHAASELEAGSTTVMTLADAPLLETNEHNAHIVTGLNKDADTPQLENVNLAEAAKQRDGLKKKRQLEMGLGRAGGYAGYDDDEFEELGGTGAPSRRGRGEAVVSGGNEQSEKDGRRRGFQIGSTGDEDQGGNNDGSDLFAMETGRAISLEPSQTDV